MKTIPASELRAKLFDALDAVEKRGEHIRISRDGREVAALMPMQTLATTKPEVNIVKIKSFCKNHRIREFSLFGSILRDDFNADSDVDVLIAPATDKGYRLTEWFSMQEELQDMFGRHVDLLTKRSVIGSRNKIRKQSILDGAKVIYAAK